VGIIGELRAADQWTGRRPLPSTDARRQDLPLRLDQRSWLWRHGYLVGLRQECEGLSIDSHIGWRELKTMNQVIRHHEQTDKDRKTQEEKS
jgi:hypothetical protein